MCLTSVCLFVCLMVFNVTFNNILFISGRSVLLVEETRGPGENHRPVASHWQALSHNVAHLALIEIRTQRLQNTESRKGLQQNQVENTNSYKNNSQKLDMRMRLWLASVNGNIKQICEQHQLLQSVPITTDACLVSGSYFCRSWCFPRGFAVTLF
jgi:hypothetical protein